MMPWKVTFSSKADEDYNEGYSWYEDRQEGLGEKFLTEFRNKIKAIELNPEAFGSRDDKKMREARLEHFPYSIVYRINKRDQTIYITSIHHTKRHPKKKYRKR